MSIRRLVIVIVAVVAVSIVNIYHHALSVKYGYELSSVQRENSTLRVSIASLEGKVTQLASPSRLRAENERMQLSLVAPGQWRQTERAIAMAENDRETEPGVFRQ